MARFLIWLSVACLSLGGIVLGIMSIALLSLPDIERLKSCLTTEMFKVRLCPSEANYSSLRQVSPYLIAAVIISEDAAFYQHHGFDFNEIKNSLDRNLTEGNYARGGSTISQQLVKNVFLTPEKSLIRKVKEAFLTYELERIFKKNEILERYLNVVEFGKNIYGVKAAAQYYFSKSPSELNVLESAFLVTLLPNPQKYSASYRQGQLSSFMKKRVLTITGKLRATGRISPEEYDFAKNNVDLFPWKGLGSAVAADADALESIEKTDFTSEDQIQPEQESLDSVDEIKIEEDIVADEIPLET